MVFFSIALFIMNVAMIAISIMKILKYAELQEDHLNPTDFAKSMNGISKLEVMCQAAFSAAILIYFALNPAHGFYLKFLLMGVNAGYLFLLFARYSSKRYLVDPAKVWMQSFKNEMQRMMMTSVAFSVSSFLLCMFNLIREVTTVG
uniref:Uncharacterized protein n=1 Tax=Hanusia phi TaxID=3032 RepID=A0A7S0EVN0_9CRYP|mmetsp:Transcript_30469/g.68830  ORF Transcript_30469/g.68830 Transcript_30469/m.68830 type:complete len:146 (+) Transcript_30469:200-637(+)